MCGGTSASQSKNRRVRDRSTAYTDAIRNIPIPTEIVDALREHIGSRTGGFVFSTKNGTPWNADLLLKRHLRGKLNVANGNLHMFRHTFATRRAST